jgi:hypothetical protein
VITSAVNVLSGGDGFCDSLAAGGEHPTALHSHHPIANGNGAKRVAQAGQRESADGIRSEAHVGLIASSLSDKVGGEGQAGGGERR